MTELFVDIETASLIGDLDDLLLFGAAVGEGPVTIQEQPWGTFLGTTVGEMVSHGNFDPKFFLEAGVEVPQTLYNTQVMGWVLNENTPLDLEWMAWHYAQVQMDKRLERHSNKVWFRDDDGQLYDLALWREWVGTPTWERFKDYNRRDVEALRKLFLELKERLDISGWTHYWETEEVPYTRVLLDMELRGMPVDLEATAALAGDLEVDLVRLEEELLREGGLPAGFNLNSPVQLNAYLFGRVVTLNEDLRLGADAIACIKSCLAGEHEDCWDFAWNPKDGFEPDLERDTVVTGTLHMKDCLPEGFTLDSLGREVAHGHWTFKGRGLAPTPHTVNKVTGEEGKLPSTSSPELLYKHAADPWVRKLCTEYRKTEKLLTTYLRVFPKIARPAGNPEWDQPIWTSEQPDGSVRLLAPPPWPEGAKPHHRLYGHFNQTGTVTGRLSSSGPNLQNQPSRGARGKAVRNLFRAPEGHWLVVADYDQLEMRLMAHFSGDPRLVEVFRTGQDPHEMLAHAIFGDVDVETQAPGTACSYRDAAKNLNYAMGYGAGRKKIAQTLCLLGFPTTPEVAGGYLSEMERFYHGLFRWKQRVIAEAKRKGYVKTIGGRRRRLRATFADVANWKLVGYGERQAVNTKVQGSAADILRRAMLRIDREIHELLMIAQVHDELVLETGDARVTRPLWTPLMKLQDIGERGHGFDLRVPLIFTPHVGRTWAEAKVGDDLAELYEEDA